MQGDASHPGLQVDDKKRIMRKNEGPRRRRRTQIIFSQWQNVSQSVHTGTDAQNGLYD
jgi:hypothetical protein